MALIVQLSAAQLSQADHHKVRRLSFRRTLADPWYAMLFDELLIFQVGNVIQAGLGNLGQRFVRAVDGFVPQKISDANPQLFRVFEIMNDGQCIRSATAQFSERGIELVSSG